MTDQEPDEPTTDRIADDRTGDRSSDDRTADEESDDRTLAVEIPERTAVAIAKRVLRTEFETVDEYVAFALGQLLRELDRKPDADTPTATGSDGEPGDDAGTGSTDDETGVDGATDEEVAERLESLGYLE